jgi:hypothetical protein
MMDISRPVSESNQLQSPHRQTFNSSSQKLELFPWEQEFVAADETKDEEEEEEEEEEDFDNDDQFENIDGIDNFPADGN